MTDINNSEWNEVAAANNSANMYPEGMAPSSVNDNLRETVAAIKRWYDRINANMTSTGTANAQVLEYLIAPTALRVGDIYRFIPSLSNTGPMTLDVGLGAFPVTVAGRVTIAGDVTAGAVADVVYKSSEWQLINPLEQRPSGQTIIGPLDVSDDVTFHGDLTIVGGVTAATLHSQGDVTFDTALTVHNTTMTGNLTTAGSVVIGNGLVVTANGLTLTGNANISGNCVVAGQFSAGTGTSSINGNLIVAGQFSAGTGTSTIAGNLNTAGLLTAGTGLTVTGTIIVNGQTLRFLNADTTFYISGAGSDGGGDGSFGSPWLTIQHAINTLIANTIFGGHTIILSLQAGYTYTNGVIIDKENWVITSSTNVADDVLISVSGATEIGIWARGNAQVTVQHVTVASATQYACTASSGGILNLTDVNFNASDSHIVSFDSGIVNVLGSYLIKGSATRWHMMASGNAVISVSPLVVSSTTTVSFSEFAHADDLGYLRIVSVNYAGVLAVGTKFAVATNGVINTFSGGNINFFPGDAPGIVLSGGQYA